MKNIFKIFVVVFFATTLSAKSGIDLELGAGVWEPTMTGAIKYSDGSNIGTEIDLDKFDFEKDSSSYLYVDFNHFVPIIPNIRIEKVDYKISGDGVVNYRFGKFNFNGPATMTTDIKQLDMIAYWSVPFIGLATGGVFDINFGLDMKKYDGFIELKDATNSEKAEFDETLPLVYLNAILDVPFTPIKVEATTKFISYDGAEVSDNFIKLSYRLPFSNVFVDFNLDLGYRVQNITIPDSLVDDLNIDIDTKGAFYGLNVKF